MSNNNRKNGRDNSKIKQVLELLQFALSLDDDEVIKATIESVIEILKEEINE